MAETVDELRDPEPVPSNRFNTFCNSTLRTTQGRSIHPLLCEGILLQLGEEVERNATLELVKEKPEDHEWRFRIIPEFNPGEQPYSPPKSTPVSSTNQKRLLVELEREQE